MLCLFFFKKKTAYEMRISDWSSDVCSSDLAAALATGNSVLAKPAEQTTLVGFEAVKLLHEAGVPEAVLQLVPGDGVTVGAALTGDPRIAGVVFTGSNGTALAINRALAARDGAIELGTASWRDRVCQSV